MEPSAERTPVCFTFWFAGFGADTNTTLRVYQRPSSDDNQIVNNLGEDILVSLISVQFQIYLIDCNYNSINLS